MCTKKLNDGDEYEKSCKNILIIAVCILFLIPITGCFIDRDPTQRKVVENLDEYIGRYSLISFNGDKNIKKDYEYYYIELKENGEAAQKSKLLNKKQEISYKGTYIIREDDSISIFYSGTEDYIQNGKIKDGKITLVEVVDESKSVYQIEK